MNEVIPGILYEQDMVLLDETVLIDSLISCMKPFIKKMARESKHPVFVEQFSKLDPEYLFNEEEVEKLSTVKIEDILRLASLEEQKELYRLIGIYLDNSYDYSPYERPKKSKDFSTLISDIRSCEKMYGKTATELANRLLMYKSLFVDRDERRSKGTEYKGIYNNLNNLRVVHHSLKLVLNTTVEEREKWLIF